PRPRRCIIAQSLAIDVTNHCRALGAARPIPAGTILTWRKGAAFGSRTSQHVVTVWCKAHAGDDLAPLAQRRVHAELVVIAVQIVNALGNYLALEVLPRATANAIARIDGSLALGNLSAQIRVPGLSPCAVSLGQLLTVAVGSLEPTTISPFAWSKARNKKRHRRWLG